MRSFVIEIAWDYQVFGQKLTNNIKKITYKVSKKIGYNSGINMKNTWLLKVEYILNGSTDLYKILNLSS